MIEALGTGDERDAATYTYTLNGRVQTVTDAKGNTTSFGYDGFDRLSAVTYADGSTEQFSYDAAGNVTSWTRRDNQTITYTYDNLNRVLFKNLPGGTSLDVYFDYDLLGRVTEVSHGSDGSSNRIAYTYDKAGRRLTETNDGRTVSYSYDAAGNRTRVIPDRGRGQALAGRVLCDLQL